MLRHLPSNPSNFEQDSNSENINANKGSIAPSTSMMFPDGSYELNLKTQTSLFVMESKGIVNFFKKTEDKNHSRRRVEGYLQNISVSRIGAQGLKFWAELDEDKEKIVVVEGRIQGKIPFLTSKDLHKKLLAMNIEVPADKNEPNIYHFSTTKQEMVGEEGSGFTISGSIKKNK